MRVSSLISSLTTLSLVESVLGVPHFEKRDEGKFHEGQPISGDGKGAPILGQFNIEHIAIES